MLKIDDYNNPIFYFYLYLNLKREKSDEKKLPAEIIL